MVICQLKNQDTQLYNYIASHNGFTLCDVVPMMESTTKQMVRIIWMVRITITAGTVGRREQPEKGG